MVAHIKLMASYTDLGRENMAALLFALGITLGLLVPGTASPAFGLAIACFVGGHILSKHSWGPAPVGGLMAIIAIAGIAAVPISAAAGGRWVPTLIIAAWTVFTFSLYLVDHKERILGWLVPCWIAHTAVLAYQYIGGQEWPHDYTGLAQNVNIGAGFTLLGIVYALATRRHWLSLPLATSLLAFDSRWALMTFAFILSGLGLAGQVSRLTILLTVLAALTAYMILTPDLQVSPWASHIKERFALTFWPKLWPLGFVTPEGVHNLPLRMASELGIIAGVAWVGASALALWYAPRFSTCWWLLATVVCLSMMDYYFWMPVQLTPVWWILVSMGAKEARYAAIPKGVLEKPTLGGAHRPVAVRGH